MTRRPKYSPEVVKKLTDALRLGATYKLAANYAGIAPQTLSEWQNIYPELREQLKEAEGAGAVGWLVKIEQAAAAGTWQAAAWKLERRYFQDYGRHDRIDHQVTMEMKEEARKLATEYGLEEEQVLQEVDRILAGRK